MQTDGMGDGMHTFRVLRVDWRAELGFRQRGVRHRHPFHTASLPAAPCTVVRAVLLTTVRSAAPSWRMECTHPPPRRNLPACRMRCVAATPWPSGLEIQFWARHLPLSPIYAPDIPPRYTHPMQCASLAQDHCIGPRLRLPLPIGGRSVEAAFSFRMDPPREGRLETLFGRPTMPQGKPLRFQTLSLKPVCPLTCNTSPTLSRIA